VELLLVRHGVTAHNLDRIFMGWDPVPLAAEGRAQIAKLAERLAGERVDRILASDVARAKESAEIIAGHLRLPVAFHEELREVHVGDAKGVGYEDAALRWPGILDADGEVPFPGGESFAALADRAAAFLRSRVVSERDERVVVVTHGGVVRGVAARLLGKPLREVGTFAIDNASLTVFRMTDGHAELVAWNDVAHLA
jgi:2,3-bisphosphoglycerate-dependent phosphoglycerate mutase